MNIFRLFSNSPGRIVVGDQGRTTYHKGIRLTRGDESGKTFHNHEGHIVILRMTGRMLVHGIHNKFDDLR